MSEGKPASSFAYIPVPLEQPVKKEKPKSQLIVGVPKERLFQEHRVALNPEAVGLLVRNGIQVYVEHNAGLGAQYTNRDYIEQGAQIAYSTEELYEKAHLIVKVAPLSLEETQWLKPKQILISAVHVGSLKREYLVQLMRKQITAIGFEFIQSEAGGYPIVHSMSEIAGISAIHIASELLSVHSGGVGLLLGGITGVPPATVTILGAGTVGYHACKTALAMGAVVKVLDLEIYKLRRLTQNLSTSIYTAIARPDFIAQCVMEADVVIGAIYKRGERTPVIVTEEMVQNMKEGSVIIDVSIDQGGCVETSEVTNHRNPTFIKHGVIHYCVPNIPARVPRTASAALSNILSPLILKIHQHGSIQKAIQNDAMIRSGIYTYHRYVTQRSLAELFQLDYMDIDLLYPSVAP